jgi:Na+-transporting methylmalonyl-CoA/oxaloacetate decarboxylase gamma subunit
MKNKKMIILIVLAILVITILMIGTVEKDSFRESDVTAFEKTFIPEQYAKCLKKNKYSTEDPTAEQKAECEVYAKRKWDEVSTLNDVEE